MSYQPKRTLGERPAVPDRPWWASIPEAASHIGFERRVVRDLIADGHLRAFSLPGVRGVRVDLRELDKLMGLGD